MVGTLNKRKAKCGFSLVEIMIVVAIIGLIMASTLPSFVRAREQSQHKSITNNLRNIQAAKDQWAMEKGKATSDIPSKTDLAPYFDQNAFPNPIANETYSLEAVGTFPYVDLSAPIDGMTRIYGTN